MTRQWQRFLKLSDAWGFQSLTLVELEERIATAAEKAPTRDPQIQSLRIAINAVKSSLMLSFPRRRHKYVKLEDFTGGTERHESRRVDNQLRGRAGRQGDPGSTRFFCH